MQTVLTTPTVPCLSTAPRLRRNLAWLLLCLLTGVACIEPATAANKYWAGASGTTNTPTSGTWQTTTPIVWSDGTVATANAGWTAGDNAFFGGTDGAYAITVGGAISAGNLSFLNAGYSLTAPAAQTITLNTASGRELLNPGVTTLTNITLTSAQTVIFGPSGNAPGGTLLLLNGAAVTETSSGRTLAVDGWGTVVSVQTGASFKITSTGTGAETFSLGTGLNCSNTLSIDGGTVFGSQDWTEAEKLRMDTVDEATKQMMGVCLRVTKPPFRELTPVSCTLISLILTTGQIALPELERRPAGRSSTISSHQLK